MKLNNMAKANQSDGMVFSREGNTDFLKLVRERQSDRKYHDKPVEAEKLERCLEAARLAPSACNAQPWKFIVITDVELKNSLAEMTTGMLVPFNHFTRQAPLHIVLVMEPPNLTSRFGEVVKDKKYTLMDIGIAASHFCLQAAAEGLGTCMIGWFNEPAVRKLLNIPANKRPMLIITLGYPAGKKRPKKRKEKGDIISYNTY
jgi:nitroreductase